MNVYAESGNIFYTLSPQNISNLQPRMTHHYNIKRKLNLQTPQ